MRKNHEDYLVLGPPGLLAVLRVLGAPGVFWSLDLMNDVNDDGWPDEFLQFDLVQVDAALPRVGRGVHVCAGVFRKYKVIGLYPGGKGRLKQDIKN